MTNHKLRSLLKQCRRQIPPDRRAIANAQLSTQIRKNPVFRRAQHIAAYVACQGEAAPFPLLLPTQHQDKTYYLPVLHPFLPRKLLFAPWTASTPMRNNQYGIPEPIYKIADCIKPIFLDLVLTPLLGFDKHANRLGMGGGYYDCTFAFRRYYQHWQRPFLLGIAFNEQRCESLEVNPWDIALDAVVTPDNYFAP